MDTRVGAYAVIVQDGAVLLSHWNPRHPTLRGAWSLPGGGMEIGEQPAETAVREVLEETGFTVELDELLGVHSRHMEPGERLDGLGRPFHALIVPGPTGGDPGRTGAAEAEPHLPTEGQ